MVISIAGMVIFIFILLIGVLTTDGRSCGDRQALEAAVCNECEDPFCFDCASGSSSCLNALGEPSCMEGYNLFQNKCKDCETGVGKESGRHSCKICEFDDSGAPTCL